MQHRDRIALFQSSHNGNPANAKSRDGLKYFSAGTGHIEPERLIQHSPGQRPGFEAPRTVALKARFNLDDNLCPHVQCSTIQRGPEGVGLHPHHGRLTDRNLRAQYELQVLAQKLRSPHRFKIWTVRQAPATRGKSGPPVSAENFSRREITNQLIN